MFLGDYIDRGEESRQVLSRLMAANAEGPDRVICLMGNHERMLLNFLEDPTRHARRWLQNGGLQTLASFGVALHGRSLDEETQFDSLRDRLTTAMGPEMIEWLGTLPLTWHSGNVWAVHAGASPKRPMENQIPEVLLWGHPQFLQQSRDDHQWIVHGHTVVEAPQMQQGRIAVDTGAYATNVLSAAAIATDSITFLQTGGE